MICLMILTKFLPFFVLPLLLHYIILQLFAIILL